MAWGAAGYVQSASVVPWIARALETKILQTIQWPCARRHPVLRCPQDGHEEMPSTPQIAGAALLGKEGQTTFSTGLGSDPRFKALFADRAWLNELRERRLTT